GGQAATVLRDVAAELDLQDLLAAGDGRPGVLGHHLGLLERDRHVVHQPVLDAPAEQLHQGRAGTARPGVVQRHLEGASSAVRSGPASAALIVAADSPVTATVSAAEPWPTVPSDSSTSATTYSTASVRRAAVTK